jgi:hypothetical protein
MVVTRKKLTVTLPEEQIEWIDGKVSERVFANVSHGVELCVIEGQRKYGKPKK